MLDTDPVSTRRIWYKHDKDAGHGDMHRYQEHDEASCKHILLLPEQRLFEHRRAHEFTDRFGRTPERNGVPVNVEVFIDEVASGLPDKLVPALFFIESQVKLRIHGIYHWFEDGERFPVNTPQRIHGRCPLSAHHRAQAFYEHGKIIVPQRNILVVNKTDDAERGYQDTGKNKDQACRYPEDRKNDDDGNRERDNNSLHGMDSSLLL